MGLVTPERLNAAIAGQIREIVLGALEWEAGDVVFEIGARRAADLARMDLPLPNVILEGIRRAANVKRLIQRLGSAQAVLERLRTRASTSSPRGNGSSSKPWMEDSAPAALFARARQPGGKRPLALRFLLSRSTAQEHDTPVGKKIQYKTEGGNLGS